MVERKLYAKTFEPIVQPREYLERYPPKKDKSNLYQVEMVYPQPLLVVDLCDSDHLGGDVTFLAETKQVKIVEVEMDGGEILHFRVIPIDDFRITWMGKPKGRPYLTTKEVTWSLQTYLDDPSTNPAIENLQLHEFFQFEDTEMWVQAQANVADISEARLAFFGWRLLITEVAEVPKGIRPTRIPTEGYPGTSSA